MKLLFIAAALWINPVQASELYAIKGVTIEGRAIEFSQFKGKALLIVNTALGCGFTPQLSDLEELYLKFRAQGLEVLGFPSNDFGGQEPGTNEEISKTCRTRYSVTFPLLQKTPVTGKNAHPVYQWIQSTAPQIKPPAWNFSKVLISRDGKALKSFSSSVKPMSKELTEEIQKAL
jgi:glutathione peroxidase